MVAVEIITYRHIERRGGRTLFLISPHMQIGVVGPSIRKTVNQPRIAMISKHDRLISGENRIKITVRKPMGMFRRGLQSH